MTQNKNHELAEVETDSIQILDLDYPSFHKKDTISIEDDIFMNVRPSTTTNNKILHQRRNQPLPLTVSSSVYPKQTSEIYITKVIPKKTTQPKPLILNHTYKGPDPGLSRQQQSQLLDANLIKRMRPRLPKVYQTTEYSEKKEAWKEYAAALKINDLMSLLNLQNYGNVHKILKMDKLIGTMAWVELFYMLRVLDLTNNNITYIEGLSILKHLENLDLSQNLITKIENLEAQINMKQLHLRENKIQIIENIFHMKKLDNLSLQGNCIFEINDALGKIQALRNLYLQNNRIKKLKPSLKNLRLFGFMIYGNGMNYDEPMNKDVLEYIRSTYCSVYTEEFLPNR